MNDNEKDLKYVIPHNFTDNGKVLGFIEKESVVSALVWFIPITALVFKFLPVSMDVRIFIFILIVCPPTLLLLIGIGGETCIDFLRFASGFLKRRKVYIYERKDMGLKLNIKHDKHGPEHPNTLDWLPIKGIKNGIVEMKDGRYIKIIEISPINFMLSSRTEKHNIITAFRSLLNICDFPVQILVQSWKADTQPHVRKMEAHLAREPNESCRQLMQGYISLVRNIGSHNAVSRRFFLIFTYIPDPGVKDYTFEHIVKKLNENRRKVAEYISQCGNKVIEHSDEDEFTAAVLYTCLNRKKCVDQSISGHLKNLLSPAVLSISDMNIKPGGKG